MLETVYAAHPGSHAAELILPTPLVQGLRYTLYVSDEARSTR